MDTWVYPQQCCLCLGPPETTATVSKSKTIGTLNYSWSVEVPICQKCYDSRQKPAQIAASISVVVGVILGIVVGIATSRHRDRVVAIIMGGVLGFFAGVGVAAAVMSQAEPARLILGWLDGKYVVARVDFRNREYQKRFNDANKAHRAQM